MRSRRRENVSKEGKTRGPFIQRWMEIETETHIGALEIRTAKGAFTL